MGGSTTAERMARAVAKHSFTWTDVIGWLCENSAPEIPRERIKAAVVDCIEGRSCSMAVAMAIIELIVREEDRAR